MAIGALFPAERLTAAERVFGIESGEGGEKAFFDLNEKDPVTTC